MYIIIGGSNIGDFPIKLPIAKVYPSPIFHKFVGLVNRSAKSDLFKLFQSCVEPVDSIARFYKMQSGIFVL